MYYRTRHLEALKEVDHEGLRKPGERFFATDIDAEYLKQHGKAKDAVDEKAAAKPEPKPEVTPAPSTLASRATRAKPANAPTESLVMTSRDLPGPAQDGAPQTDATKPRTDA